MRARRSAVLDDYAEAGQVAIYSEGGIVVVLSELAGVAWDALGDDWTTAEELAVVLVEAFGEPPEGHTAVQMTELTLHTLSGHGIVELDGV